MFEPDIEEHAPGLSTALTITSSGQRRPGISKWATTRQGPSTAAETFQSVDAAIMMLKANEGLIGENVHLFENLVEKLGSGVHLYTDFSGMGGAEVALRRLITAVEMSDADHCRTFQNVSCVRATDKTSHCQQILQAHSGKLAPRCVFGDIIDRMNPELLMKLKALHARAGPKLWTDVACKCNTQGKDMKAVKKTCEGAWEEILQCCD